MTVAVEAGVGVVTLVCGGVPHCLDELVVCVRPFDVVDVDVYTRSQPLRIMFQYVRIQNCISFLLRISLSGVKKKTKKTHAHGFSSFICPRGSAPLKDLKTHATSCR